MVEMTFRTIPVPPATVGALADPTSIIVRTGDPSGDMVEYTSPHATIVQQSTGIYRFTFPAALTEVGRWWVYVAGSGNGVGDADEISFPITGAHVPAA